MAAGLNWYIPHPVYHLRCDAVEVTLFRNQRVGPVAAVKCHIDDLAAFGYEQFLLHQALVTELRLREVGEQFETGLGKGSDVDYVLLIHPLRTP